MHVHRLTTKGFGFASVEKKDHDGVQDIESGEYCKEIKKINMAIHGDLMGQIVLYSERLKVGWKRVQVGWSASYPIFGGFRGARWRRFNRAKTWEFIPCQ